MGEYQIQIKTVNESDGVKRKIIQLTDLMLHTTEMGGSSSGKAVKKAFDLDRSGRISLPNQLPTDREELKAFILKQLAADPNFVAYVQEEEKKGYKIAIELPYEGVPTLAGKDTLEFVHSKNGKRILRKLAGGETKD